MEITGKIDTERAATVGIITYDNPEDEVIASLDELERLLETAGGRAVIRLVQSKENPDVRTFLGSGKMKELAELCRGNDVTLVVCDSELSPSQIRNMEDILDSGLTLEYLKELLMQRHASDIRIATLLDKPARRAADIQADYTCFEVPDEFVVGYGLDFAEKYRNLPYVGVLKPEVYEK